MSSKKNLKVAVPIFGIAAASVLIVVDIILVAEIILTIAFIILTLLSTYSFFKGIKVFITSHSLIERYRFRLEVLENRKNVPISTNFVTPLLHQLKQQQENQQQQQKTILLSKQQQTIKSLLKE